MHVCVEGRVEGCACGGVSGGVHVCVCGGVGVCALLVGVPWTLCATVPCRFRGKLTVFTVLCEQYQPSLRRDPMYNEVRGAWGQALAGEEKGSLGTVQMGGRVPACRGPAERPLSASCSTWTG